MMKHVKLLIFLVTLPSLNCRPDAQRSQLDTSLRGHSFGLENFLFQSYEGAEIREPIRNVRPKRVRPVAVPVGHQTISADRGHTYGLENLSAQVYESNRIKPFPTKVTQDYQRRRPVEQIAESSKPKESFVVKKEPVTEIPQKVEPATQEVITERIRKRIMMKRRRKRPSNVVQTDENSEVNGNAILKPVRIPVFPQVPKVVIRTKLPDSPQRLKPVGVKSVTTEQPVAETQVTTETEKPVRTKPPNTFQKVNPTSAKSVTIEKEMEEFVVTTEMEKSTVSTSKEPPTTEEPSTVNLKTFLKQQTETLSLSELLQTQNLSLTDLLQGNKDASAILKVKQLLSSTTVPTTPQRKTYNRVDSESTEPKPPKRIEVFEVTTLRPNYNRFHAKPQKIKLDEVVQEKPPKDTENNFEEVQTPPKRQTTGFDPQNRLNELRTKLRNFQRKTSLPDLTTAAPEREQTVEQLFSPNAEEPYKKNRVPFKSSNNPELSVILPTKQKPEAEIQKRPDRITKWTNRLPVIKRFGQDKTKIDDLVPKPIKSPIFEEESEKPSDEPEEVKTTTTEANTYEEPKKPEPKDELIELLKSGQNADRLQKILHTRNMTIQELLDNREKPPLQMNISELFTNEKRKEITTSSTMPTLFDSLPNFELEDRLPEAENYDEPFAEESAPTIARVKLIPNREPKELEISISEKDANVDLNLKLDDLKADTSNAEDSALWKLADKSIYYGSSYGYGATNIAQKTERSNTIHAQIPDFEERDYSDIIHRRQDTNRKFKLDYSDFVKEEEGPQTEDIEKSYIPPAVKSAIIASGVVMGIALFVFIVIFATCGWKQRQIRLKGSSSILGDTLKTSEKSKRTNTLSPVSFKDNHSYKKTIDFEDESSESGSSNTSSYLWNTLKHTFTNRTNTLKSRLEKEEKLREDRLTLRRNESRRKVESRPDDRSNTFQIHDERFAVKKIDRDRNVINTSFSFKRSSGNNSNRFNECVHGY